MVLDRSASPLGVEMVRRPVGNLGNRENEDQVEEQLDEGRALVVGRDHRLLVHWRLPVQ